MNQEIEDMPVDMTVAMPIWSYDITWDIKEVDSSSEAMEKLKHQLTLLMEKEDMPFKIGAERKNNLTFSVRSSKQLNITKWQTALQKKVIAYLKWHTDSIELSRVISHSQVIAKEDQRLSKLINQIKEIDYYDLEEGLTDEDCTLLKDYLKGRRLGSIEQKGQIFLLDYKALHEEINLNCFECTKRHQYGCCCGSPCTMSEKNMALLDRHLVAMEDALQKLDQKQYQILRRKGGFISVNGEIKAFDGHCAFLIQHEGVYKCMAHKYALDEQIPIYALCPLSCLMYPLEIMELITDKKRKIYLITSAVEENFAASFSRWGSYTSLEVELRCIRKEAADEGFKQEAYKPVYQVNQGLLIHEFGNSLYQGIAALIEADHTSAK